MQYYFSVMTMSRNDGRYIKEFLEYYLLVGVEHFYWMDHSSTDNTYEVLLPYIVKGLITYIFVPGEGSDLKTGLAVAREESQWVAMVDVAEFLVPKKHITISEMLKSYETYGALAVNRQLFPTNGTRQIPLHASMLRLLNRKIPASSEVNAYVKLIVQPSKVEELLSLHQAVYIPEFYAVDSDKQQVDGPRNSRIPVDVVQLNHYTTLPDDISDDVVLPDNSIVRFLTPLARKLQLHLYPTGYNWQVYIAHYPDLIRNGITTELAAAQHWLANGQKEGRVAVFNWHQYLRLNSDLGRAGITTEAQAVKHWLVKGRAERRPR